MLGFLFILLAATTVGNYKLTTSLNYLQEWKEDTTNAPRPLTAAAMANNLVLDKLKSDFPILSRNKDDIGLLNKILMLQILGTILLAVGTVASCTTRMFTDPTNILNELPTWVDEKITEKTISNHSRKNQ